MNRLLIAYVASLVIGILLIIVSNLTVPLFWQSVEVFWNIVGHLGIAFVVAGFTGASVDTYFRRQTEEQHLNLQKEINDNVFHAVLRQSVPPSIYDQIKSHILTESFLRKDFKLTATLTEVEQPDYLRGIITFEYELQRLVDRVCTYEITSFWDLEKLEGIEESSRFLYLKVESLEGEKLHEYEENNIIEILTKGPDWVNLHKSFEMNQYSKARVTMRAELYYRKRDYHIQMMTGLTENLSITFYAPEKYKLEFSANHPSQQLFRTSSYGMLHSYEFQGGLLPYQGVTVYWKPKEKGEEKTNPSVEKA